MSLSQIIILLQMVLNLLVAAQNPNIPQSLKDSAIQTANYAIDLATIYISESQKVQQIQPSQNLGIIEKPKPQIGEPQFVTGKDNIGKYLDIVSIVPLSEIAIYRKNGELIFNAIPNLVNTYTDGGFHYANYFNESFLPDSEEIIYFTIQVKAENGAEYTSPLWRASRKVFGSGRFAEECIADYCR